jgi:hypothetical protein
MLFQGAATPSGAGFAALTNALANPRAKEPCQAHQAFSSLALEAAVRRWFLRISVLRHDFMHVIVLFITARLATRRLVSNGEHLTDREARAGPLAALLPLNGLDFRLVEEFSTSPCHTRAWRYAAGHRRPAALLDKRASFPRADLF